MNLLMRMVIKPIAIYLGRKRRIPKKLLVEKSLAIEILELYCYIDYKSNSSTVNKNKYP